VRPIAEQTILVTGATDGLGRQVALDLAEQGATLILHGRDHPRGAEVLADVHRAAGHERSTLVLADLSSLDEIRRLAAEVEDGFARLDVLVNNAGLGGTPDRRESGDGHELVLAVNYRYYDGLEESTAGPQAYDADSRRRLWTLSEELTGARFEL